MTLTERLNGGPFHRWFEWTHLAATVALATLLATGWNAWREADNKAVAERMEWQASRLRLEAKIEALDLANKTQDILTASTYQTISSEIRTMTVLIEAERTDIRQLQLMLDNRVPRGLGNYLKREIERGQ